MFNKYILLVFNLTLSIWIYRFSFGDNSENNQSEILLGYCVGNVSQNFDDVPDSFAGLPRESYPLVVPYHKFLIMLDGTMGGSFFNRFNQVENDYDFSTRTRSEALEAFMQKEVDFGKFHHSYWPQFPKKLTKNIQSLTAFTEIVSHIKGGLRAWDAYEGKISRKDYVSMSENRISTLDKSQRENLYDIFQQYERKKEKNGEYDWDDLVMDLHRRLGEKEHGALDFDFVYVDEVQDLTMVQIALFKHVCKNVDGGFVFAGDTAQTIGKGVHFRFEDIRHLFYEEFVLKSSGEALMHGKGEKGLIPKISHLSQSFRSHAGILNLAQSVIDIVHHFFPLSIDFLNPETSLIPGETPVLVERVNKTEFASMLSTTSLGPDQVILVRDESSKKELSSYSGNRNIVLTISECKDLEFRVRIANSLFLFYFIYTSVCNMRFYFLMLYCFLN